MEQFLSAIERHGDAAAACGILIVWCVFFLSEAIGNYRRHKR